MQNPTLKTQTITFKNSYENDNSSSFFQPNVSSDFGYNNDVKTVQITNESNLKLKQMLKGAQLQKNNKIHRKSKLELANPYFIYIPKFYLNELKLAKALCVLFLGLFVGFLASASTLIYYTFTEWKGLVNPYILLLLIFPFIIFLFEFLVHWIKFRNFNDEAKTINFRDEKRLTLNVQRLYKNLKTAYVDINWISITTYVLLALTILVDAISVMFKGYRFGDFNAAMYAGDLTYNLVFWSCASSGILIFIIHFVTIFSNFLRASNIENFYNIQVVEQEEIDKTKKHKNYRDAIIFFIVVGSFIYISWFIFRIVASRVSAKKTTVVVK